MKISKNIGIIFIIFCYNLYGYSENKNCSIKNDSIEIKYSIIMENLTNYYVIDLIRLQSGGQMSIVKQELSDLNKSYYDYQADSAKFYQAITEIFQSDYLIIKYFCKYREDSDYKKIRLDIFDEDNSHFSSIMTEKRYLENGFYAQINNVALTMILNYYLNTEKKTIILYFDAVYIKNECKSTEDLYQKLDKIFKKYGYDDKEKIRKAILEEFGKCIDQSQLAPE